MNSSKNTANAWRLIVDKALDGAINMAIDEAILEAVGQGNAPPTLRLYRWEPPCLSLGFAQPAEDVDVDRLKAHGWGLVRRMTGGRAILHTDEITYSVALPADHALAQGTIVESYRRLSLALLDALQRMGIQAGADKRADPLRKTEGPICFETPSDYEITAEGKKLLGSAQVRKQNAVLQHGSLPLWGDVARITDALCFADDSERATARARVLKRATTFEAVAHQRIAWAVATDAFANGFRHTFSIGLEPAILSEAESTRANALYATRYSDPAWIFRR